MLDIVFVIRAKFCEVCSTWILAWQFWPQRFIHHLLQLVVACCLHCLLLSPYSLLMVYPRVAKDLLLPWLMCWWWAHVQSEYLFCCLEIAQTRYLVLDHPRRRWEAYAYFWLTLTSHEWPNFWLCRGGKHMSVIQLNCSDCRTEVYMVKHAMAVVWYTTCLKKNDPISNNYI